MYTAIHPKLPMRNMAVTKNFYITQLGFSQVSAIDYEGYLMIYKDEIEIHFFEFIELKPLENYGQVYIRTNEIDKLYNDAIQNNLPMPTLGHLQIKPWGQKEFSLLDPDHNLLTFGEAI